MDPGTVISGITAVVKAISFIVEHSKKGTPKYAKDYKDSVMAFKGVNTKGWPAAWYDEWYWISQETENQQGRQFVFQNVYFYLPSRQTTVQTNWVQGLLTKDEINLQDIKNWFELLEDSANSHFKNIYLFDEITKTTEAIEYRGHARVSPGRMFIRKDAHVVLFNDDQVLSAPGMAVAKRLGHGVLSERLFNTWQKIPGPSGVTAKQITVVDANTFWVLDNNGSPWQWKAGAWSKRSGTLVNISAAPDGTLWGTNSAQVVYRYSAADNKWAPNVPAGMKQVAAVNASSAWGLDSQGTGIFYWSGSGGWEKRYPPASQLAVGTNGVVWGASSPMVYVGLGDKSNVWGLNASDQIFKWDGASWQVIPGALRTIAVGSDGTVMGTNSKGEIFKRVPK